MDTNMNDLRAILIRRIEELSIKTTGSGDPMINLLSDEDCVMLLDKLARIDELKTIRTSMGA